MIVAIDGPAGVGKSSVCKIIAEKCSLFYLNSGNFYRAITYKHLKLNRDPNDKDLTVETAKNIDMRIEKGILLVDGKDIEKQLHAPEIDLNSSRISVNPKIRLIVNDLLRKAAEGQNVICEGRDITTVVFPDADYKFYLDATAEVRANRRYQQDKKNVNYKNVLKEINERDEIDKNKPVGALKIAPNAIFIDTSYLTINEVCAKVLLAIKWQNNDTYGSGELNG
ncbi:MAG: (d)CMP kinase [Sphaerochaetaceae bacterium]|nr:(d)CMP kinase [Sphaerochaetaceae bacterium]